MLDIVKGHSFGLMRSVVDMDMIASNYYQTLCDIGRLWSKYYVRLEPGSEGEFDKDFPLRYVCENPTLLPDIHTTTIQEVQWGLCLEVYVPYGMSRFAIKDQLVDLLFKEHCAKLARYLGGSQSSSQFTKSRPLQTGCSVEFKPGRVFAVVYAGSTYDL